MENAAPQLHKQADTRPVSASDFDDNEEDPFDSREIFDLIRNINDPEHPHSLEELNVVQLSKTWKNYSQTMPIWNKVVIQYIHKENLPDHFYVDFKYFRKGFKITSITFISNECYKHEWKQPAYKLTK